MSLAYLVILVYLRYSSDGQRDGMSFDRQRASAERYLASIGIEKSDPRVVWIEDPGLSAFHGEHLRSGQLGKLVAKVRARKIVGGLLICEAVSRASRQGAFAVLPLIKDFLDADFTVKLLDGPAEFNRNCVPKFFGTMLALQADLAHAESQAKSEYSLANWAKRRTKARTEGTAFTSECPRWLKVVDGKYEPIKECVESVVKVFELALEGWGITRIVSYANQNNWTAPAKKPGWHLSLVNRLLRNRALIGEFQPYQRVDGKRAPLGEPIESYYPKVIDDQLFHAVQGIRRRAAEFPSRRDENNYNYLIGIARCACGGAWRRLNKNSGKQAGYALYACSNRVRKMTQCPTMSARRFDVLFIGAACNKIPALLALDPRNGDEVERLALESQLSDLQKRQDAILRFIETNPDLAPVLGERLRVLVTERREIESRQLRFADYEVPRNFSFGDAVSVFIPAYIDVFDSDSPLCDMAFRVRAHFRARLIEAVQCVEVARDRSSFTVTLKNGNQFTESADALRLESDGVEHVGFGPPTGFTDAELEEEATRVREELVNAFARFQNGRTRPS